MKKSITLILCFALCLSFAACRDKSPEAGVTPGDPYCVHQWCPWITQITPTCTALGSQMRSCLNCGKEEKKALPKINHKESDWIVKTKATDDKPGVKCTVCLNCDEQIQTAEIPAGTADHTHKLLNRTITKHPTCTESGIVNLSCFCGYSMGTETLPAKHKIVTTERIEATCGREGWTESEYCSACYKVFRESQMIPQLPNHTPVTIPAVAATCTKPGATQGSECSSCGSYLQIPQSVPKLAHKFTNGVCACGMKRPSEGLSFRISGKGYSVSGMGSCTDSEVVIPETYNGKEVIAIDAQAFMDNTSIRGIYIPDTVKTVGEKAFCNVGNLQSVRLSEKMTHLSESVFENCVSLKEIDIPDNLGVIYENCFAGCTALKKVNMNDVSWIRSGAFSGCTSLTQLTLSISLRTIEEGAFTDCGLKEITYRGSRALFVDVDLQWYWSDQSVKIHCVNSEVIYSPGGHYSYWP